MSFDNNVGKRWFLAGAALLAALALAGCSADADTDAAGDQASSALDFGEGVRDVASLEGVYALTRNVAASDTGHAIFARGRSEGQTWLDEIVDLDLRTGELSVAEPARPRLIRNLSISPDGQTIAWASEDSADPSRETTEYHVRRASTGASYTFTQSDLKRGATRIALTNDAVFFTTPNGGIRPILNTAANDVYAAHTDTPTQPRLTKVAVRGCMPATDLQVRDARLVLGCTEYLDGKNVAIVQVATPAWDGGFYPGIAPKGARFETVASAENGRLMPLSTGDDKLAWAVRNYEADRLSDDTRIFQLDLAPATPIAHELATLKDMRLPNAFLSPLATSNDDVIVAIQDNQDPKRVKLIGYAPEQGAARVAANLGRRDGSQYLQLQGMFTSNARLYAIVDTKPQGKTHVLDVTDAVER